VLVGSPYHTSIAMEPAEQADALAATSKKWADAPAAKAKADALDAKADAPRDDTHEEGEVKGDNKQGSEAEEEEKAEANKNHMSDEDESEEDEAGTGTIRVIRKQIYEDMMTVVEFQALLPAPENCTREIFMDRWAVYRESPEVTRYQVLSTTVAVHEVLVADMTIQDLLNAYPVAPGDPPNTINVFIDDGVGPPYETP
jgi:predicted  nucleic acid-binding Zn-ribbon protein